MKKRAVSSIIIIASILFVVASASIVLGGNGGPRGRNVEAAAAERVYSVELDEARSGTVRSLIRLNGEVVPTTNVDTYPEVSGEVQRLFVRLGDRVRRGQVVANIDPSRPGARFEVSPVTAPITGTVTAIYVDQGGTVSTATPIVAVGELDTLEVVVDIPERFVSAARPGMTAEVELSAFSGDRFTVAASEISPLLDSTTRTKEVRFLVDPVETGAEAGMFAEVTIVSETRDDVVVIPVESIITRSDRDFIFTVIDDSIASLRPVQVGLIENQLAEIREGLDAGEAVVVRGQSVIEEGSSVQVLSADGLRGESGGDL